MPLFNPTEEQMEALLLYRSGRSLAIEAGAGTGKTSTLTLLAEFEADTKGRRMQYLAFNKAIVEESSEKFGPGVQCSTAHRLAYRATPRELIARLQDNQRVKSWDIARQLGIGPFTVEKEAGEEKRLSESFLAGLVMRSILRFCQSDRPEPSRQDVAYVEGITEESERQLKNYLVGFLRVAWADLMNPHGRLRFDHSHYLKRWALSNPVIHADVILFDEAQDANPVMRQVVAAQTGAQVVWVGDSNQEIYAWAGAVNALARVPTDARAYLSQSFRFGQPIADVANAVLAMLPTPLRLRGFDAVESRVEPVADPDVILTRTNAAAVREAFDALALGRRFSIVGGATEVVRFAQAAEKLQEGRSTEHPELACFDSWEEVQEYVEHDAQGDELRLLVRLIDDFGPDRIVQSLRQSVDERSADDVISTAHKAKGREWDAVRIHEDFNSRLHTNEDGGYSHEELRLLYVAATRAKRRLDVSQIVLLGGDPTAVPA